MSSHQMPSTHALSMVIDRAIYPVTTKLLHQLFDPYGVEQLVVYPPITSDGEPCVAADVRFRSERAAAQAYADWDGRCIYYRCCRLQMWVASADVLPVQSSAAATPATDTLLHKGENLVSSTPSISFHRSIEPTSILDEFVLASGELVEPPAPVPTTEKSMVVTPTVLIDTISVAPATYSWECPSRDANKSTPASTPAAAPTSPTAAVDVIPVLDAPAAGDGTLDGEPIKGSASPAERSLALTGVVPNDTAVVVHPFRLTDCVTQVVTALSPTPATTMPPLLWASGSSLSHASAAASATNDDSEHGTSLTVAPVLNSEFGVPVMLSTPNTTEVGVILAAALVGIAWALTRPWLETVPPRPPDPWSLSLGAFSGSRLEASIIAQSAVNTALLCNDTEEVPACVLFDEAPQPDEVQQQPWPPPELEILCLIDINSWQLTNANFEVSPCPVQLISEIPIDILVRCSVLEVYSSGYAPSFLRIYLTQGENQKTPCLCEVILDAIPHGPDHFRWEIAWVLIVSSRAHTNFGGRVNLTKSYSVLSTNKWWLWSIQCSFELFQWKITGSECCEIASAEFKTSLLPKVVSSIPVDGQTCPADVCMIEFGASDLEDAAATSAPHTHATALKCSLCILIPAEFGGRGISKLIWAAKYDRENKVPYHGTCLGMQLSEIEVFEHILGLGEADTATNTPGRVILYMPEVPVIIDPEHWSLTDKTISLIWSSKCMELIRGSEQGCNFPMLSHVLLSVCQHVKYTQWSWDPGDSMFAVCNSQQWWTTLEHLHCPEELQWSSVFSGQVQVSCGYYLDQAHYFDTICSNIIYYHADYYGFSTKTKEAHMPWDPGKLLLCYQLKLRLGDKPNFKEGGMLGTYPYTNDTCTWAGFLGWHMGLVRCRPTGDAHYIYLGGDNAQTIQKDQNMATAAPFLPPWLYFPVPFFLLFI